jgi:galactonate dehydratase
MTRRSLFALAYARPKLKVTRLDLFPVRATGRTMWLFVRLGTDQRLTGLGEASDGFGFAGTSKAGIDRMQSELKAFFEIAQGHSPLEIERYRQLGDARARAGGLVAATAYSAIEQALWDLAGQALDQPIHALLGGRVRDRLPVYANINRTTKSRTPEGFAATTRQAIAEGFSAVKAAPFDGFPAPSAGQAAIERATDLGVACVEAIRAAAGPQI